MMKLLTLSGFLFLTTWAPATAAPPAAPSFGEAVDINVVNVDVSVTDKQGQRVTGLGKNDFELLEDGRKVPVSNFEAIEADRAHVPAPAAATPSGAATAAAAADNPRDDLSLVVYFDDYDIHPSHRARAVLQLRQLLAHDLDAGTRVMLVTDNQGLRVRFPFTTDPAVIARGLAEIETATAHGGETDRDRVLAYREAMEIQKISLDDPTDPIPCPLNIVNPIRAYADSRRQEILRTIGAMTVMVNSLSGVPGRKALLHVSDGLPVNPGEELFEFLLGLCGGGTSGFGSTIMPKPGPVPTGPRQSRGDASTEKPDSDTVYDSLTLDARSYQAASQASLDAQSYSVLKELKSLAAHANAHRVTLYTLQASGVEPPFGASASSGPEDRLFQFPAIGTSLRLNHRQSLQLLADTTGGRAILDANDFLPGLLRMRDDLDSYYSLGFTPSHNGDGREHQIEVRAKRPGLTLRYRQTYRDKPTLEKVVDRTLAALFYGFEDNPLAVSSEVGDVVPAAGGLYAVPIRLRIPLFKLAILNQQDKTYGGKLRVLVAARDDLGGTTPVRQVEVPLNIPSKEVLSAMGQYYVYTLTLNLRPGLQHVALAVRDEVSTTTSYLSQPVSVAATAAVTAP